MSGVGRGRWVAWLVVVGVVLAALNLRAAVTSTGAVLHEISAGLEMSGALSGLLTTLPVVCFAVFGAGTPWLARRAGEQRLLVVALGLIGAGLLARAVVGSAWLFLAFSVVALAGIALGNVLIPTLIKRHFSARIGVMMTVYATSLGVGTMLGAALTLPIERAAGGNWRVALGVWASMALIAAVPWLAVLRDNPKQDQEGTYAGPRTLVRSRLAWAIAGYFGSQGLLAYVLFGWLLQVLLDGGYTEGQAGLVLGVFTALSIPSSLVVPALTARMRNVRKLVVLFCTLYAVGFAGLLTGHALWGSAIVVGIAMGGFPMALALLPLRTRTAEGTAALSGFAQSVGYLIAGVGPLMIGLLYDATGGWTWPFTVLFVVVAAQLATGWYAGADRVLEDEIQAHAVPDETGEEPETPQGHIGRSQTKVATRGDLTSPRATTDQE
ncbi:CynX/NimT family MFS transporter [Acrocarpospora macrocephala]|uniref:CynX/NimT family MFS transporter n=2 Tax=Acrocarpospora macrocephala TaxID=150177 RepID=UPI0031E36210